MKLVTLAIFAVGVSALMATDLAALDGTAWVKQRQTEMGRMGQASRAVKPILKGENANVLGPWTGRGPRCPPARVFCDIFWFVYLKILNF